MTQILFQNCYFSDERERGLELVRVVLDELSAMLENSSMEIPPTCISEGENASGIRANIYGSGIAFAPLLERAHARKKDAVEADGIRWQLTKKEEELMRMQRALKGRESDLGTMKVIIGEKKQDNVL